MGPVISIDHVYHLTEAGEEEIDSTVYVLQRAVNRLQLRSGYVWPDTATTLGFRAEYTTGRTVIPLSVTQAILLIIGELYANRELSVVGTVAAQLPVQATDLLANYVVHAL
jgi:hypothetical protein